MFIALWIPLICAFCVYMKDFREFAIQRICSPFSCCARDKKGRLRMRDSVSKSKQREKLRFKEKMPRVKVDEETYPSFPIERVPKSSEKEDPDFMQKRK